nr:SH3 domain-containing protein [Anaerolineae bacterium]
LLTPACTAQRDLELRQTPASAASVIGSVRQGNTVEVDRQAAGGAWLRVAANGGWAPLADFICVPPLNPALLQVEVIPAATALPPAATVPPTRVPASPAPATVPATSRP